MHEFTFANARKALQDARQAMGFLTEAGLAALAASDCHRLTPCLVRWHEGRAVVSAQDVAPIIAATEAGGWTVRDVSIPAPRRPRCADCNGVVGQHLGHARELPPCFEFRLD